MTLAKQLAQLYQIPEEVSLALLKLSDLPYEESEKYFDTYLERAQSIMELKLQTNTYNDKLAAFLVAANIDYNDYNELVFKITKMFEVIQLILLDPFAPYISCQDLEYYNRHKDLQKTALQNIPSWIKITSLRRLNLVQLATEVVITALDANDATMTSIDGL